MNARNPVRWTSICNDSIERAAAAISVCGSLIGEGREGSLSAVGCQAGTRQI